VAGRLTQEPAPLIEDVIAMALPDVRHPRTTEPCRSRAPHSNEAVELPAASSQHFHSGGREVDAIFVRDAGIGHDADCELKIGADDGGVRNAELGEVGK